MAIKSSVIHIYGVSCVNANDELATDPTETDRNVPKRNQLALKLQNYCQTIFVMRIIADIIRHS